MEYPNPFDGAEVISTYTDGQAVEDGVLVAIGHKDRVSRALWEYLVEHAPLDSRPPNRWPVDMLGWFEAGKMGKDEARNKLVADKKALALSKGLISTHASQAKRVYEENIGGGIYKLFSLESLDGKRIAGLLAEAPQEEYKYSVIWLLPNENGGTTAMFPARGISEDERALLTHISRWGSSGYPVSKCGSHHWTWGPWRSIEGPPVVFPRKRDAVESFEKFMHVLRDAIAGRI